ncbi:Selenocysteine lyase/Cysteine desulfurase [Devosia enhydra]|uniref:Selenocysteine lyase/Cysteine desulfurase n=1 Tax=Devosia enhydra TaxID=665118 RepID=A0A1K2HY46_9HYPH|nr:aminotransferase class V-fold PLP-dependent enzyme [Devosia enhydra]SFZ84792.1 Selenocysteine lyase/Cysteine desulfurase [Devosia enhydra]
MSDPADHPLLARIRDSLVGDTVSIPGPFGPKPLVYADYTASGRSLDFIEEAVARLVAPTYANTHTETSYTGLQTTALREGARAAIRKAVNADDRHAVIFTGSGATSAINKLVRLLTPRGGPAPVVFVGPYEHHSNDLPWRECGAKVLRIPLCGRGLPCLDSLAEALAHHADAPVKIGAFSAASNVTGVITPLRPLARLLHAHGGWLLADYAAAGPYLSIDMAESALGANDACDAVSVSPHKFVGGPGASGVLIADRVLLAATVPSMPGGGTVSYVTAHSHRYVADAERREEAGTPNVMGDIRAGLVFQLKADIGHETISALEQRAVARIRAAWSDCPGIAVLGPAETERLAIFSFNIRSGERLLHPNFVVALLNDLFGIQARGGCSCAGPYAHDLLGIGRDAADHYAALVGEGLGVYRPGWVRLNVNFFFEDRLIDYIARAVRFIAEHGAAFLPAYRVNAQTGRWTFGGISTRAGHGFADLCLWRDASAQNQPVPATPDLSVVMEAAHQALAALTGSAAPDDQDGRIDPRLGDPARWFALAEPQAGR